MTPSFLIVEAQRCGTTSLYRTLVEHPAVLPVVRHSALPPVRHKEIHYFDNFYAKGMSWYRAHFPLELTARRVAQSARAYPVTGEASPYYMFHPLAPERIRADLPDVRLVVQLRDPVERAYSMHALAVRFGFETDYFAPWDERLARFLGREPSWRR